MKLDMCLSTQSVTNLKCDKPDDYPEMQVDDGYLSKSVFDDGQDVEYKCAPGYMQTGGSRKSYCKEGHWTPLKMKCHKIKCKPLSAIHRGRCMPEGDSYGDKAVVKCDEGLNGEQQLRCGAAGSWTPSVPTCEPVSCPDIDVANGQVTSPAVSFNAVVQIICSPGFQLNGEWLLRCGADGSWTPNVPTCEPVLQDPQSPQDPASRSCSAPVVVNGGIKGGVKPLYKIRDTVIIVCKAGCYMGNTWQPIELERNSRGQSKLIKANLEFCSNPVAPSVMYNGSCM
ncbi:complement receptor type 2-like [Xyrauchen texanus]|uniref:complement receptor type 2-like n=1 Tax=Xyrauchen texanus TaxID=154827 RepID=UPI002242A654|nr:complement receptor type 2-like [Xyrauchen texanus]